MCSGLAKLAARDPVGYNDSLHAKCEVWEAQRAQMAKTLTCHPLLQSPKQMLGAPPNQGMQVIQHCLVLPLACAFHRDQQGMRKAVSPPILCPPAWEQPAFAALRLRGCAAPRLLSVPR